MKVPKAESDTEEDDNKDKRRVTKELPLDLGVVNNLINHDTVKNLMGRDASVPTDINKRANRQNEASDDKFDLETKLYRSGQFQLNDSMDGEPENPVRRRHTGRPRSRSPSRAFQREERPKTRPSRFEKGEETYQVLDGVEVTPLHRSKVYPMEHDEDLGDIRESRQYRTPGNRRRLYSNGEASMRLETIASMENRGSFQRRQSRRQSVGGSYSAADAWALVDAIALDSQADDALHSQPDAADEGKSRVISAGNWELSSLTGFVKMLLLGVKKFLRWTTAKSNEAVDLVAADATYAVVTFTSRQAAVAARKVLADGRGSTRWVQLDTLPIPPLADAAACDLLTCRGCCRPVTLSINDRQKKWRRYA